MKEPLKRVMKRESSCLRKYLIAIGIIAFSSSTYLGTTIQAQTITETTQKSKIISGVVTDGTTKETLVGVTVMIEGTTKGVVTGINGEYSIEVTDPNSVLIFNSLGFEILKVSASTGGLSSISLTPSYQGLDEVVVIGYGTSKKKDLTGAISNVGSKEFNQGAITSPLQQIAGKAAGVNITQVGNEPGVSPSIRIRGITSLIGGSDPLVVVDGIQGNLEFLKQIPANEIETIDILKDASATAIYGSRGAAGVVLVTTKKGKAGQFSIEYTGSTSVDVISNKIETLSASEWR